MHVYGAACRTCCQQLVDDPSCEGPHKGQQLLQPLGAQGGAQGEAAAAHHCGSMCVCQRLVCDGACRIRRSNQLLETCFKILTWLLGRCVFVKVAGGMEEGWRPVQGSWSNSYSARRVRG
jgi:hypothetical protein